MGTPVVGREETLVLQRDAASPHPDFLAFGDGEPEFVRVDDPVLRPLMFGAPALGWEGDHRLVVFSQPLEKRFVLFRLCPDGEYRWMRVLEGDRPLSEAGVNRACRWLVAYDARRGFNVAEHVSEHNAKIDRENERRWDDERGALSDRLAWAVKKDMGAHLGGSHFDFAVGDVPWHENKADVPAEDSASSA